MEKFHRIVSGDKENYLDIAIKILDENSTKYRNSDSWGLYRNTFLARADFFSKKNDFLEALNSMSKICILDMSGLGNNSSYSVSDIFLAPGIFNSIDKYSLKNKTDIDYFVEINIKNYRELDLPKCKMSLKEINEVVITAIDDFEAAESLVKKMLKKNTSKKTPQQVKSVVNVTRAERVKKKTGIFTILKKIFNI